ncbi:hypothetical protein C0995_013710 [Termitomyces sp. Mi166|nr:hypothetical protein C0995_013710 [Termitomyces sp. Mi166\
MASESGTEASLLTVVAGEHECFHHLQVAVSSALEEMLEGKEKEKEKEMAVADKEEEEVEEEEFALQTEASSMT